MILLKAITTSMNGAGMIVLLMMLPKFNGSHKVSYRICIYGIATYILSILCMWWS